MAHAAMPTNLFKSLRLGNGANYNVYLVGSRLWGTNTAESDWDLLIVGDLPAGQLTSLHKSQHDVKLLDRQEFIARVEEGSLIEVVCALMRREDMLQHAFDMADLAVDPEAMKTWLDERQTKDLEKAGKFWLKGNRQPGWKILRHILHGRVIYNHLAAVLRQGSVTLTINDVQTIVRSATFLCDKTWMQLDWEQAHAAAMDALTNI